MLQLVQLLVAAGFMDHTHVRAAETQGMRLAAGQALGHLAWFLALTKNTYESPSEKLLNELQIAATLVGEVVSNEQSPIEPERLRIDFDTLTIILDGKAQKIDDPKAFAVYKTLFDARPHPLTKAQIQEMVKGCQGKNKIRQLIDALPTPIRKIVQSGHSGYWIDLAPVTTKKSKARTPIARKK